MGELAATVGVGWKDHQFRSCQAQHVGICPQEDRRRSAGEVGEVEGAAEESCLDDWGLAAASTRQAFILEVHFTLESVRTDTQSLHRSGH
jgi:hypothetical protein